MNKLERHRREITAHRISNGVTNWRAEKKYVNKAYDQLHRAFDIGGIHAYTGYNNPYPAGRRHDEYDRGYNMADPMGSYHGQNL